MATPVEHENGSNGSDRHAGSGRDAWRVRLVRWAIPLRDGLSNRRTSALLTSLILHTALFLLLALLTYGYRAATLEAFDFQWQEGRSRMQAEVDSIQVMSEPAAAAPPAEAIDREVRQVAAAVAASEPNDLAGLLEPQFTGPANANTATELERVAAASALKSSAPFVATGVDGRELKQRAELALSRGATLESEQAVERALEWLARHQLPNGAWSLVHDGGECNGRCDHVGSRERFDPAATGLSLLAFLGAGYTHRDGKHRETVRRGIYYLIQIREELANSDSYVYQSDRGMYNHGIAAFALCEAYQMTKDPDFKAPAERAAEFIVDAQSYQGGWGYLPKKPGDLTLSGWQMMALKSSYASGYDIPAATLGRFDLFLNSQTKDDVRYGYRGVEPSTTCTAIGMLMRMFRGRGPTDPRIMEGVAVLEKLGPSSSDAYFNYYSTLALFHVGGNTWQEWHPRVREHLINTQADSGHASGSWYFEDPYGREGGRLYTTAMSAMTLEVYYRYAPLYQNADVPFEL